MASSVLMLGAAKKSAGDQNLRLPCDFGDDPFVIALLVDSDGEYDPAAAAVAFASYNVTCSGDGAPLVAAKTLDYPYQISAAFSGGDVGTYDVVFTATLTNADATVLSRTGTLEVI